MGLGLYIFLVLLTAGLAVLLCVVHWRAYTQSPEGGGRLRVLDEQLGVFVADTHANIMRRARLMRRQLSLVEENWGWFVDNTPRAVRIFLWVVCTVGPLTLAYYVTNAGHEFWDTRTEWQRRVESAREMGRGERNAYLNEVPSEMLDGRTRRAIKRVKQNPQMGFVRHGRTRISGFPGSFFAVLIILSVILVIASLGDEVADVRDGFGRGWDAAMGLIHPPGAAAVAVAPAPPAPAAPAHPGAPAGGGIGAWITGFFHDLVTRLPRELIAEAIGHRLFGR